MADVPPSSKAERNTLIQARKRDLPRPAPTPPPPTLGAGRDAAVIQERQKANRREQRINEIGVALGKNNGKARREFSRDRRC